MQTRIGGGGPASVGKTYAVGFWRSQDCDNSLASFPSGIDFSWGILSFELDGLDADNYVEIKILDTDQEILQTFKYTENGRKEIDLSQYINIPSTQDVVVRVEVTTYI